MIADREIRIVNELEKAAMGERIREETEVGRRRTEALVFGHNM